MYLIEEWDDNVVVINGFPVACKRANLLIRKGSTPRMFLEFDVEMYERIDGKFPNPLPPFPDAARDRDGDTLRWVLVRS